MQSLSRSNPPSSRQANALRAALLAGSVIAVSTTVLTALATRLHSIRQRRSLHRVILDDHSDRGVALFRPPPLEAASSVPTAQRSDHEDGSRTPPVVAAAGAPEPANAATAVAAPELTGAVEEVFPLLDVPVIETGSDVKCDVLLDAVEALLSRACTPIAVVPSDVDILDGPPAFYKFLLSAIASAQHSIVLSALFIGSGPLSQRLVHALCEAIERRLRDPALPALTVTLLFDFHRMQVENNLSSVHQLLESLSARASTSSSRVQVRVGLLKLPSRLGKPLRPFSSRACEALGVQHTKLFIFDDRHVMLTGANLSDDYFVSRRDRYMVLRDNKQAAMWYRKFVDALLDLSYSVTHQASGIASGSPGAPYPGLVLHPPVAGDAHAAPTRYVDAARRRLTAFARDVVQTTQAVPPLPVASRGKTTLYPTVQLGRLGIYHDACVLHRLIAALGNPDNAASSPNSSGLAMTFASPYLNCSPELEESLIRATGMPIAFMTAGLRTNAWHGDAGVAGLIPALYARLQRLLFQRVERAKQTSRVHLLEFAAPDETFHGKGFWISRAVVAPATSPPISSSSSVVEDGEDAASSFRPAESRAAVDPLAPVVIASFGSTNFGSRSTHLDVEAQGILVTRDADLQHRLAHERDVLMRCSAEVTRASIAATRKDTGWLGRLFAAAVGPVVAPYL